MNKSKRFWNLAAILILAAIAVILALSLVGDAGAAPEPPCEPYQDHIICDPDSPDQPWEPGLARIYSWTDTSIWAVWYDSVPPIWDPTDPFKYDWYCEVDVYRWRGSFWDYWATAELDGQVVGGINVILSLKYPSPTFVGTWKADSGFCFIEDTDFQQVVYAVEMSRMPYIKNPQLPPGIQVYIPSIVSGTVTVTEPER